MIERPRTCYMDNNCNGQGPKFRWIRIGPKHKNRPINKNHQNINERSLKGHKCDCAVALASGGWLKRAGSWKGGKIVSLHYFSPEVNTWTFLHVTYHVKYPASFNRLCYFYFSFKVYTSLLHITWLSLALSPCKLYFCSESWNFMLFSFKSVKKYS